MVELEDNPQQLVIPTDFNSDIVHYVDSAVDPDKAICGKFVGNERWAEKDRVDCIVCLDLLKQR